MEEEEDIQAMGHLKVDLPDLDRTLELYRTLEVDQSLEVDLLRADHRELDLLAPARQEAAHQEPVHQAAAHQGAAHQEAAHQEAARQGAARQEAAHLGPDQVQEMGHLAVVLLAAILDQVQGVALNPAQELVLLVAVQAAVPAQKVARMAVIMGQIQETAQLAARQTVARQEGRTFPATARQDRRL